jgi:hypothetical protein
MVPVQLAGAAWCGPGRNSFSRKDRWMTETLVGRGRVALVQRMMAFGKSSAAMALAVWLLGGSASHARAETLRWKLNSGEVLRYTIESKQVENFQVMGRNKKSTRSNTTNLIWTVKNVSANGDAEIVLRFERLRMRVEQPPFVPLEFDSGPNKLEIPDEFEAIERQIKALAGAELAFKLRPNGEVDDLKIPEKTLKSLREGVPQDAAGQGTNSEQALKDILLQSSPPVFPLESLEPGKSWAAKLSKMAIPGLGTLKLDKVFTFQGPDSKTPRLLLLTIDAKASLEPAENVTAKIRAQEGTGSLTFDAEAGRIVNSRNKQKMEMIITDRGQDIIQSSDTTSTMTLEP